MVMSALSVNISVMFTVEMCLTLELIKVKHVNRKPISDFLFDGNSNVSLVFYSLRDIYGEHELVL